MWPFKKKPEKKQQQSVRPSNYRTYSSDPTPSHHVDLNPYIVGHMIGSNSDSCHEDKKHDHSCHHHHHHDNTPSDPSPSSDCSSNDSGGGDCGGGDGGGGGGD